jgi:GNAT superfamily N-acetyltransferase
MIRLVTKQQFNIFESKINPSELFFSDKAILEIFHEFIDDYEDDEIDVHGFFDNTGELIGLIRFSEENIDYLFEDIEHFNLDFITLIGALFVHPTFRRKGIGSKLVDFAISEAETEIIATDPYNIEESNFFNSFGFSHQNDFGVTDEWILFKRKIS